MISDWLKQVDDSPQWPGNLVAAFAPADWFAKNFFIGQNDLYFDDFSSEEFYDSYEDSSEESSKSKEDSSEESSNSKEDSSEESSKSNEDSAEEASSSNEDESSEESSKSDENSAEASTEESTDDVKSDEEDFGITTIVSLELPAEVLPANITFANDQTEDDEEAVDFQDTADDSEDDDEGSGYYVYYEY